MNPPQDHFSLPDVGALPTFVAWIVRNWWTMPTPITGSSILWRHFPQADDCLEPNS